MRKFMKRLSVVAISAAMVTPTFSVAPVTVLAAEDDVEYTIYPAPHSVVYQDGTTQIPGEVNVVYGEGIDSFTQDHLEEVFSLLNTTVQVSDDVEEGAFNVLVGVEGTNSAAEAYFSEHAVLAEDLFEKTDSYALQIGDGVIAVLGKDTDGAFYGLTSLRHIFTQTPEGEVRHLVMEDYADVATRGFIEGYYGNPWSHEDRMDLMRFGGNYKLNGYIYAPKDDPKHNSSWRSLYTEEELEKQAELAQAGNESKCYYIYALHPFMYNAISFGANYESDLNIIKTKFSQLMDAGVKQFAILADDAAVPSNNPQNYVTLMTDLTEWMEEKALEVEGLKTNLIFCPNDYMGMGSSSQMQTLKQLPESVSIIQTGGRVWGEVGPSFNNTFYNNMGRPAFMWINWPCSDNTKDGLIMGGAETVLKPNVNPSTVNGIVLNPMQQSEPSKQGIFTNADYAWNIWESADRYDDVWNDSFNYIDHGTIYDTTGSIAYRELSKHMKNSQQLYNEESEEIKDDLAAFLTAYRNGENVVEKATELKAYFENLQQQAINYRLYTGNTRTLDQIIYWIDAWDDTTAAIINYLDCIIAFQTGKTNDVIWDTFAAGQEARDASETHLLWYIDHYEKAVPGRKYVTPFMNQLDTMLSARVSAIVNPNIETMEFITNRTDTPTGTLTYATDGNAATEIVYQTPNSISTGTYVGVLFGKTQTIHDVTFRMGHSGNMNDTFSSAKVQYTTDGTEWQDLNGEIYTNPQDVEITDLNLKGVKGLRMIATSDKSNTWLGVRDIVINTATSAPSTEATAEVSVDNLSCRVNALSAIVDDSMSTYAHLAEANYKQDEYQDYIPVNASVTVTYDRVMDLNQLHFLQDSGTDSLSRYALEYTLDGQTWESLGEFTDAEVTLNLAGQNLKATAIRVRNLELKIQDGSTSGYWWKLYDFQITKPATAKPTTLILPSGWGYYSGSAAMLTDGDPSTFAWFNKDANVDDAICWDMGEVTPIGKVSIVMGNGNSSDKFKQYALEYSTDNENWTTYKTYKGVDAGTDEIEEDFQGISARYVRIRNTAYCGVWVKLSEFNISGYDPDANFDSVHLISSSTKNVLVRYTAAYSEMRSYSPVELASGEWVGMDVEKIRTIEGFTDQQFPEGIDVEVSRNGYDWVAVNPNSQVLPAGRYVRLINNSDAALSVDLSTPFGVYTPSASAPSLLESDMGINSSWGVSEDSRDNGAAFDGNVDTTTEFADYPLEGQYILYDLGQMRTIRKVALFCQDSAVNYIRDADILISSDLENWTKVVTIGDGIENTNDANITAVNSDAGYVASSAYPNKVAATGEIDPTEARYLKIVFTASNMNRAVLFNEIMINDGEYVPIYDPAFTTDSQQEKDYEPVNMLDGNLTSAWRPATSDAGYLQYDFSSDLEFNRLNIIQRGTPSNALVKALVLKDGQKSWVTIGRLSKSLNELGVPGDMVFSLRFEWEEGHAPTVSEIISFSSDEELPVYVDKSELASLIAQISAYDSTKYTPASWQALTEALDQANEVIADEQASQEDVLQALTALQQALDALEEVAQPESTNKTLLQMAIAYAQALDESAFENLNTLVKEEFDAALAHALEVNANETASQSDVDGAWARLTKAIHMLGFTSNKAELEALIVQAEAIAENLDQYLEEGQEEFLAALEHAKEIAQSDTALDDSIAQAVEQLRNAMNALQTKDLDLTLLEMLVNATKDTDLTLYTEATVPAFQQALEAALDVLTNPQSQEQVDGAVSELHEAWLALRLKPSEEQLKQLQDLLDAFNALDVTTFSESTVAQINETRQALSDALVSKSLSKEEAAQLITDSTAVLNALSPEQKGQTDLTKPAATNTSVSTTSTVKTAAAYGAGAFAALAAGALAVMGVLKRRKK